MRVGVGWSLGTEMPLRIPVAGGNLFYWFDSRACCSRSCVVSVALAAPCSVSVAFTCSLSARVAVCVRVALAAPCSASVAFTSSCFASVALAFFFRVGCGGSLPKRSECGISLPAIREPPVRFLQRPRASKMLFMHIHFHTFRSRCSNQIVNTCHEFPEQ